VSAKLEGDTPRRRRLRQLSTVLIVAGALVLVDAVLTVVWQEPLTAFTSWRAQAGLNSDLSDLRRSGPTRAELDGLARLEGPSTRTAYLARSLRQRSGPGSAVGRIRIPAIGLEKVVVAGTRSGDLRKGPGIYDQTVFPGAAGTTAIAGHRTTFGAPFRDIDDLDSGDEIVVEMPYATLTYRVRTSRIVPPTDVSVLRQTSRDQLVLSACHPLFSAEERIVVFADLVASDPLDTRPTDA
jgi:sortase A